jgi:hypothetical protein
MGRLKDPAYRRHRQSGQAIVTLSDGDRRRDYLLGTFGSKESKAEYRRLLEEWHVLRRGLPDPQPSGHELAAGDLTVAQLLDKFWQHA